MNAACVRTMTMTSNKPVGNEQLKPEAPDRIRVHSSVLFQVDDEGEPFTAECITTEEDDGTGFEVEYVRASAPVQGDVISRAEALAIPEAWESSDACNGHSDNPCCHVRTAAAIAERIAALPATSPQATPDARELESVANGGITVKRDADGTPREVRYLTDDRDSRHPLELVISWGNNGDWYVYTAPPNEMAFNAVRLCTSGGISSRVPGVNPCIAQVFRLLAAADNITDAWHWLYKIADSEVESFTPWAKLEALAVEKK